MTDSQISTLKEFSQTGETLRYRLKIFVTRRLQITFRLNYHRVPFSIELLPSKQALFSVCFTEQMRSTYNLLETGNPSQRALVIVTW